MIKFLSDDIWPIIKSLSGKSRKTKVAVAYFGAGAATQLALKKGDTLLVAMTLSNVKAGQVNPFEIEKLYNKGVHIFNLPNLHSKIYLFDKSVIIGSANVSSNSADTLIESGLLTDDIKTVSQADSFIKTHCIEKVEQDYIEVCKKNYNPPKFFGSRQKRTITKSKFKGQLSRLWVISTKHSSVEDEIPAKDDKHFDEMISNKRTFKKEKISYPLSNSFIQQVREGDIIIEVFTAKVNSKVFEPKRALGVSLNKLKTHKILLVEERKNPKTKGWKKLENILRQNGVKAVTKNSTREIKNDNTKKILLDYFS